MNFKTIVNGEKKILNFKNITEATSSMTKLIKEEGHSALVQAVADSGASLGRVFIVTKKEGAQHWDHPNFVFDTHSQPFDL